MEYANKTTGHIIDTRNRVTKFPSVMGSRAYMKARITESISAEELSSEGYVVVIQPNNPLGLQVSDVRWDGERAYRETLTEDEMIDQELELE